MSTDNQDPHLELIERFAARGAEIRVGNLNPCMIRHLLDTIEEQAVTIRGLEEGYRKLNTRLQALEGANNG